IRSRTDLAYKPQRRWVGRLDLTADRHLIARAYRPADLPATLEAWQLAPLVDGQVLVPTVRETCPRRGLVVTSWLDGTPLDQLLARSRVPAGVLHEVGVGLARLHSAGSRPARPAGARDGRLAAVETVATQLALVLPELDERVRAVTDRLAAEAPAVHLERPGHGDFSTDQVIVDPAGRIGITDWDRAGWADPAADLGSLRAAGLDPVAYDEVLAGYTSVREEPSTVDWHLVRARLLRLPEPLRQGRPDWRDRVVARLAELEEPGR
ncbi:MAG TPA: phosphotransferase, partial [Microlunatus sp.]|nr:phosphotransferase [Microlunatus sp.]